MHSNINEKYKTTKQSWIVLELPAASHDHGQNGNTNNDGRANDMDRHPHLLQIDITSHQVKARFETLVTHNDQI